MTNEQTEKLLDLLESIDNSLAVIADYTEKLALCFEAATHEDADSTKRFIRVVNVG
jgi:hypothetical protein